MSGRNSRFSEFPMASGELSTEQFEYFLYGCFAAAISFCAPGALIYCFMDHRHMGQILAASTKAGLHYINLCVWIKSNSGMGSFYRSRHELVFVFRNGKVPHKNNVQLGRFKRDRSNAWFYPGANGFKRRDKIDDFDSHATVKPVRLVSDALLDSTHRGDVVLDPFVGSGTTVLAAERTGRRCYAIELDPQHVETAIRRWEAMTGQKAVNQDGYTLEEAAARRAAGEVSHGG